MIVLPGVYSVRILPNIFRLLAGKRRADRALIVKREQNSRYRA
jgi:hypothetical protein